MKKRSEERSAPRRSPAAARLAAALFAVVMAVCGGCGDAGGGGGSPAPAPRTDASPTVSLLAERSSQPPQTTAAAPRSPPPTRLTLVCVDEEGQPVIPSSAELLLSAWGSMHRMELEREGSAPVLRLDLPWLEEAYPTSRVQPLQRGHILLKAAGFVTLRSEAFGWLGGRDGRGGLPRERTRVRFPGQAALELSGGTDEELRVVFRRPRPRCLKIVDLEGRPVPEVAVTSEIFWTHENHCCFPQGAEELGQAFTDSEGRVELVDGDFEYGFEIRKPHWSLPDPQSCYPDRHETVLESEETVLRMRRHEPQRLEIILTEKGRPLAGRRLFGQIAPWRCGAIDGPFDVTDGAGRIARDRFYAEEWEALWFEDEQGRRIWYARPEDWSYPARILVELAGDRR